jgi:hypothetical protein
MSGSIYMFEVFISVCCAFDYRMMIQVNGVFELNGGNISMEPIDCMGVCWLGAVGTFIARRGEGGGVH